MAFDLCEGRDPFLCLYDETLMRSHLEDYFEQSDRVLCVLVEELIMQALCKDYFCILFLTVLVFNNWHINPSLFLSNRHPLTYLPSPWRACAEGHTMCVWSTIARSELKWAVDSRQPLPLSVRSSTCWGRLTLSCLLQTLHTRNCSHSGCTLRRVCVIGSSLSPVHSLYGWKVTVPCPPIGLFHRCTWIMGVQRDAWKYTSTMAVHWDVWECTPTIQEHWEFDSGLLDSRWCTIRP